MTENAKFKATVKSLRDLADRIEKRELVPINVSFNREWERMENAVGETTDFKPGNSSLTIEWETPEKDLM